MGKNKCYLKFKKKGVQCKSCPLPERLSEEKLAKLCGGKKTDKKAEKKKSDKKKEKKKKKKNKKKKK